MNQHQFDRDMEDEEAPPRAPIAPRYIRELFDQDRQTSHRSADKEQLDWCHHCNAWVHHDPEKCPTTKFKP